MYRNNIPLNNSIGTAASCKKMRKNNKKISKYHLILKFWIGKLHYYISVSQQYLNDGVKNTYTRITFYYSYSRVVYNVKTLIYDGK